MPNAQINIFNYSVKNQANNTVDIHVDGDIVDAPTQSMLKNWFGDETSTSFKSLRNQVEKADPKTINLFVNSAGGHVGDAMAIHDYLSSLENKGVTVNRNGIGIVASAATYLVMGKNSSLSENSHFLIHNAASFAYGDVNQMEIQVRNVRKFNDSVVNFYSNITGKDKATITDWMNQETWFTAQEAKDNGFVNSVTGQAQFTNKIPPEKWNFKNQDVLAVYNSFTNTNSSFMDTNKITEAIKNGFQEIKNLFQKTEKPTEEEISNSLDKFATAITNSIKENSSDLTEEKVKEIANNIIDAKKFATSDELTNATKDIVTNEKLTTALTTSEANITAEVAKSIGNQTAAPEGNDETPKPKVRNKKNSMYHGVTEKEYGVQ